MKARVFETRALPTLVEQRNSLLDEMEGIINKTKEETRAFSDDESARYDEIKTEIGQIDATLKAQAEVRALEELTPEKDPQLEKRALDEKNFLAFVRGEERALDVVNNGGIIPAHIANRIIETVKELSEIYSLATVYNVSGDLIFPVYDEETPIQATYVEDMQELTEQTGKFVTATLKNHIAGCLAKISRSLMNRTDFDLLSFVIKKIAQAILEFMEMESIRGTEGKMQGVLSTRNIIEAASAAVITADELIDLQMSIPTVYGKNAGWLMHKDVFKEIRKLKDGEGRYLMNQDPTTEFGWLLLGKPVRISECMPTIAAGNKVIVYGDFKGLYIKLAQDMQIQVLMEKYATQHAIGVVGYIECDSKIIEPQRLAALAMKGA